MRGTHILSLLRTPSFSFLLNGFLAFGCVADGAEIRPLDGRETQVRFTTPSHDTLVHQTQPPLTLHFDGAIDPRRSDLNAALALSTGNLAVPLRVSVDPIERTLSAMPADPLVPGLRYIWEVDAERLRGAGGRSVAPLEPIAFRVATDAENTEVPAPADVRWADVAPLFDHHCGCHDQTVLMPLTYPTLLGRSPSIDARRLVTPYDPARSYLIEKMVPDYPDRFGAVMPPEWSEQPPLSGESLRLIAAWIEGGAQP